jgi:hypothetical protein
MRADKVILALLHARAPGRSICPSEAARTLARAEGTANWRSLMDRVRRNAASLARRKVVVVTQRGRKVDALSAQGAIRIALVPRPRPMRMRIAGSTSARIPNVISSGAASRVC